ncbi:hypothetical protein FB45DRAFT_784714 [Roridomyces roridus]|uniref:NAD(P)-binding protein n=1 Tax=Roridomyces roridus TaxID=1738132 RepID=A0AAD7CCQ5_9AGAR|nr:hypothetical protein FB45DRAFT_784714 [Roridomyces roridus]
MATKLVYLVTGSNRTNGIGYSLVSKLAERPNAVVFAGARDPNVQSLRDLAAKHSNVYPIKFLVNDRANNDAAIADIKKIAGQLDVVVANAGIATLESYVPVAKAPIEFYQEHLEVNMLGTIVLFQAAQELLLASPTRAPIFAYISTGVASLTKFMGPDVSIYGASKVAGNFIIKALDAENPSLIAMAISPGWCATDMGNDGAKRRGSTGREEAPMKVEDVVEGVLNRIDGATKEKSSGRFWNFKPTSGNPWDCEQEEYPW